MKLSSGIRALAVALAFALLASTVPTGADAADAVGWKIWGPGGTGNGHADLLFPEIGTDSAGKSQLQLHSRFTLAESEPVWGMDDYVVYIPDDAKQVLPSSYTPTADYSFLASPGSTVYTAGQAAAGSTPWIGSSGQSETLAGMAQNQTLSFSLDAVTGIDGGAAPGKVVLWEYGSANSQPEATGDFILASTRLGLPGAWNLGVKQHAHFNWTFTRPGVYCLAVSTQADLPDGTHQQAHGFVTQVVGSELDPAQVPPCGRRLTYPQLPQKTFLSSTSAAPIVSDGGVTKLALTLRDGQLHASYLQNPEHADGPPTAHSIDDVILQAKAGLSYPYQLDVGDRGKREIGWDTTAIGRSELTGQIGWTVDRVRGPGDLLVAKFGSWWRDQKFDTANGVMTQTIWPQASNNNLWSVSRPGTYCVDMTWKATTAAGQELSDHHTLTVVVDGPLDPDDYDVNWQIDGKSSASAGPVWLAAEHGALERTCAQGAAPTTAQEVAFPVPSTTPAPVPTPVPTTPVPTTQAPTASPAQVTRATPRLSVRAARTARRGRVLTVRIRVSAAGTTPTGRVTVRIAGVSRTVQLDRSGRAVLKIVLPKRAKVGRATVSVRYGGDTRTNPARKTTSLRITR